MTQDMLSGSGHSRLLGVRSGVSQRLTSAVPPGELVFSGFRGKSGYIHGGHASGGAEPLSELLSASRDATDQKVSAELSSPNSIVAAAHSLLELGVVLRQSHRSWQLEELRARLVAMVDEFLAQCAHVDVEILSAASYGLCTFLDEAIAMTQWGGGWSSRSLLVTFHGEASGGERFFTILHRLLHDPAANLDVLELFSMILALGLEGRYRLLENGSAELERLRRRLRTLIRCERGSYEHALSLHWKGMVEQRRRPWLVRPVWWVLVALLGASLLLFVTLDFRLRGQVLPLMGAFEQVRVLPVVTSSEPVPLHVPKLAVLLAPEIAQQLLSVNETASRSVIMLNSDELFTSGSARVLPSQQWLIRRIGDSLRNVPGRVVVAGYTDNQLPTSGKPSNWQLSLQRAMSVVQLLRLEVGSPERFFAQGRGESEPLVPNNSSAGRARNRRVVITIIAPGISIS